MEPLLAKSEFTNSRKLRNLLGLSAVYGCFFVLFNWSPGVTSARLPNKNCYYIMWFSTTRMYINSVLNIFTGFQMTSLCHLKPIQYTIIQYKCNLPFVFLSGNRYKSQFHACLFFPTPHPWFQLVILQLLLSQIIFRRRRRKIGGGFLSTRLRLMRCGLA